MGPKGRGKTVITWTLLRMKTHEPGEKKVEEHRNQGKLQEKAAQTGTQDGTV